ncbi:Uncharacterised protein [Vibrio cholerae]|nr:Uncharacterised protein [Vibrio cholerae]
MKSKPSSIPISNNKKVSSTSLENLVRDNHLS